MNKPFSTYERKMKDPKFKKAYKERYKALLFSELMISIMEDNVISVRKLAKEAGIAASVIQDLRSGKQQDIKLSNLLKIAHALGFEIVLQRGEERMILHETTKHHKTFLTVLAKVS